MEAGIPPEGTTQTDTPGVPTSAANPPANAEQNTTALEPNAAPDNAGTAAEVGTEQVQPGAPSALAQASGERDPYYCPACGRGYPYPAECTGHVERGHAPLQTIATDELDGDDHTAAPATE